MTTNTLKTVLIRDLNTLKKEVNLFSVQSHLWESLPGTTNSSGNLALHLAGNLHHFIGTILGKSDYVRNREQEFSEKKLSVNHINSLIDSCIDEVSNAFKLIDDQTLMKVYPVEFLGSRPTSLYVLVHLISHFNYHLGQINYHRRYFSTIVTEL